MVLLLSLLNPRLAQIKERERVFLDTEISGEILDSIVNEVHLLLRGKDTFRELLLSCAFSEEQVDGFIDSVEALANARTVRSVNELLERIEAGPKDLLVTPRSRANKRILPGRSRGETLNNFQLMFSWVKRVAELSLDLIQALKKEALA